MQRKTGYRLELKHTALMRQQCKTAKYAQDIIEDNALILSDESNFFFNVVSHSLFFIFLLPPSSHFLSLVPPFLPLKPQPHFEMFQFCFLIHFHKSFNTSKHPHTHRQVREHTWRL